MCKSWCELIVAVVVIVFALWETVYSKWILVIAGIVLFVHSFMCKKCFGGGMAYGSGAGTASRHPKKKR